MNKGFLSKISVAAACLWLMTGADAGGQAVGEGALSLLPASGEVNGWAREEAPQVFRGDGLYKYMDGGAEIYLEYGFDRLEVQEYRNASGRSIVLEVFEMSRDTGAFGMYTFKTASRGKSMDLGREGQLTDYYLNFWSGRMLVTVTGQEPDEETLAGVEALGRSVAARMPKAGNRPRALEALPQEGMVPWSLRYLVGPIGLRNFGDFAAEDFSGWQECIRAEYAEGQCLYLFLFGGNEDAAKALDGFGTVLRKSGRFSDFGSGEGRRAQARDVRGEIVRIDCVGKALVVSVGGKDWGLVEETGKAIRQGFSSGSSARSQR